MIQEENKDFSENANEILQKQILNPKNIINEEISDIYSYIDQKIFSTFQNNYLQSINKLNSRLNQIEKKYQQQTQTNNNEINSIKEQLTELKSQINKENVKLNQFLEEKIAKNSEQINKITKIVKSQSLFYETNYFDDLKCELKQLKELLNSDLCSSPADENNSNNANEFSSDFLQEENHKIKSNLKSIKSEIKKIITNALNKDDEIFEKNPYDDLQIELTKTSQKDRFGNFNEINITEKAQICSDLINEKAPNYSNNKNTNSFSDLIKENDIFMHSKVNEIIINKINEFDKKLEHNFNSFKCEIMNLIKSNKSESQTNEFVQIINDVKYKEIETTFTINEAQSKTIEANNNSIEAQFKANDAVLRAAEAESKATSANEKADLIISDNNKMNVDIRCLKYEVKKLRSRVLELEKSKIQNDQFYEISDRINHLESKVKHLNSDFKKIKEEKIQNSNDETENEEMNKYEINIIQIKNENKYLKNELKTVKSDVKRIKDNLHSSEVISIPGDFIKKLNDTQNQSSYACEKATKTNQEISLFQDEIILKVDNIKADIHILKSEIRKMKEQQNSNHAENKSQKKDEKKMKNN